MPNAAGSKAMAPGVTTAVVLRSVSVSEPAVALPAESAKVSLASAAGGADGAAVDVEAEPAKSPRKAIRRSRFTVGVEASMRPAGGATDVRAPVISIDVSSAARVARRI